MLPTFIAIRASRWSPRPIRGRRRATRFAADFAAKTYETVEELCADPAVEIVYVATPHQHHAAHAILAARHGKHVLVEKPMALTLEDCAAMIDAAQRASVHLIVGHSHSFDAPILRTRELIASGAYGAVRMIHALNYTDFLCRPRRPEELDTAQGGGAVFNQAAHQVDIVRLLGGGRVTSVRAATGAWDATRPTEGAYSALLTFEDGAFASLTYSGYGHFDSDEFQGWVGEMGQAKDALRARAAVASPAPPKKPRSRTPATMAAPTISRPPRKTSRISISARHRELRARRPAPDAERRDDLSERRGAPRSAAAAGRAARRSDRRALRARSSTARRRCTTAPGRWRRWKSASRCCGRRAKAATSRSRIRSPS